MSAAAFAMEKPVDRTRNDYVLLVCLLLLAGLGLVNLYSASYGYAVAIGKEPGYFAFRQAFIFLPPALLAFLAGTFVKFDTVRRLIGPAMLLAILLLALPLVPGIGITKNGASRWFGVGRFMFQPSELFKPLLVLYLAHILGKKSDRLSDLVNSVLPPLIIAAAGIGLVLLQNDFSTAIVLTLIAVVMFWVAEVPVVFFTALASIGIPLFALMVLTSDYRLKRVLGFLVPSFDPADISYQVNGSLRAIRSGGLWGKGFGQGVLKLRNIPEVQSDFVFAAWVEETGLLGMLLFVALWAVFLVRVFAAVFRVSDHYAALVLLGMGSYLGLQTLLNIAVVSGVVPATGIPLPFFSAGGSSLLSVAIASGCINQAVRLSRGQAITAASADRVVNYV